MPERHQTPICSNTHNLLEKNDTYALRGVCMIMIIVHHTYLSAIDLPQCHTDSWLRFLDIGWSWGYDGTGVFLFLSGFGMFFSLLRNRPICKTYIRNKVVKLFIPFLWLWAISLAVYILFDAKQLTPQLFTSFLSLDIPPDNEAWFYKVIIGLYTVSMLIFNTFRSPRTCVAVVTAVCVAYYCVANFILNANLWWFITVLNFPFGMLVAISYDKLKNIRPIYLMLPCAILFALLQYFHPNPTISSLLFTIIAISIIRYVNIDNRLLRYIGTNSILFYFLEEPAINYLSQFAGFSFYTYSLTAIAMTMLLVFLCQKAEKALQRT